MRQPWPPPDTTCDAIQGDRLADSCRLLVADRVVQREATLDEVAAACRTTGALVEHCLAHFAQARTPLWVARGPAEMNREVGDLSARFEGVQEMASFGKSVGAAATRVGVTPGGPNPCRVFDTGTAARDACNRNLAMRGG